MDNNGYVKIYRKILDNPITCKDSDYFSVWVYLLLNATHTEINALFKNEKITLNSGQLITGRKVIAQKLNINESKVQRILKMFENQHQIEQQMSTKNRLISILNWDEYQGDRHQNEQQVNNERTTSEQQVNTYKNVKNVKNVKNILYYYGEYKNVFFTKDQYEKLIDEFPKDYLDRIQRLDDYIQSSGKKYKDCLATIRTWARKEGYKKPKEKETKESPKYNDEDTLTFDDSILTQEEYIMLLKGQITKEKLKQIILERKGD